MGMSLRLELIPMVCFVTLVAGLATPVRTAGEAFRTP